MPEENWQAHGGIPACDLCHARKVKCDRQDPCANCTAAKAECLRTRQKRPPRPKVRTDDKLQALVERLSSLEDSVRVNKGSSSTVSPGHENLNVHGVEDDEATPDRPLKRKRIDGSFSEVVSPELDTSQQQANEARNLIRKELSYNKLSVHQRSVLETALSFFDHLSQAPAPSIEDRSTFDSRMRVPMDLTHGEILNVIIGTENKPLDSVAIQFHSLDHIPPKAVERIALALIEGTDDERTLTLYRVIIHFKAAVVLYTSQLQAPKSQAVQKHIRQKQLHHLSAALTAIDHISFLTAPSLLLLQALITGAMLMQIVGNPASCWNLIAHASRTLVALGYHTIRDTTPKNESEEEIHAAIAWCAQFDSCMSLLLLRPASLPPLHIKVSSLIKVDPSNPMTVFEIIAMEMVPVHYKIIELTLDPTPKHGSRSKLPLKDEVNQLRMHMKDISDLMDKYRPDHLLDANMDIMLHWQSLEFKYFSTMTAAHRLSPTVTTHPGEREECLQCAREALKRVKFIQGIGRRQGHFIEGYDPYLAWTILSYPLCPFFVVFCNVVGTSNVPDFQLLEDVAEVISSLVTENKYVNRLHRLCVALLGFCRPLVQPTSSADTMHVAIPEATPAVTAPQLGAEMDGLNNVGISGDVSDFVASSWNDDMMWQLFQSQPSLDWFNSDILDPTWNLGLQK